MAGDWIKWCRGLHQKREIIGIAARLGISPVHAAGLCMVFWEWLDENVKEADIDSTGNAHLNLGELQPQFIDRLVGADGFAAALAAEGWLNIRLGSLVVPNFTRHNQTGKIRAMTSERVARHRARRAPGRCNADVTLSSLHPPYNDVVDDDDDEDEFLEKGGAGGKTAPPSDGDAVTLQAFQRVGRLWGRNGPTSRRDRVLLWRVCRLAACGESWAKACLDTLADAFPSRPGAYLQKLALELAPRVPNVAVSLAEVPVPPEIEAVPRPPRPRAETARGQEQETPLTAEERRAMMAEVMAVLRRTNGAGRSPSPNGSGKSPEAERGINRPQIAEESFGPTPARHLSGR